MIEYCSEAMKMAYTQLLNSIIEKSGLSLKEIAERCTADGVKITSSYISTLRNDENNRAPSDEVSRAIARACNCKYDDILVIENYIDNAPESFKGVFDMIREFVLFGAIGAVQNSFTEEEIQKSKTVLEQIPLSEMILQLSELQTTDIKKQIGSMNMSTTFHNSDDGYDVNTQLQQAFGLDVTDNSMFPILPKGSKAVFEIKELKDYSDGDILIFLEFQNDSVLLFRKVAFLNDEHTEFAMFPINTEFQTKTYKIEDVSIIGRVCQVINDL